MYSHNMYVCVVHMYAFHSIHDLTIISRPFARARPLVFCAWSNATSIAITVLSVVVALLAFRRIRVYAGNITPRGMLQLST